MLTLASILGVQFQEFAGFPRSIRGRKSFALGPKSPGADAVEKEKWFSGRSPILELRALRKNGHRCEITERRSGRDGIEVDGDQKHDRENRIAKYNRHIVIFDFALRDKLFCDFHRIILEKKIGLTAYSSSSG
jgi:hypothetical protein